MKTLLPTGGKDSQLTYKRSLTIEICGSSGDRSLAAGEILIRTLSDIGYHVISFDAYPAEIRGFGKTVAHMRAGREFMLSLSSKVDILVSLNDRYAIEQLKNLNDEGVVIFDNRPRDITYEVLQQNDDESDKHHLGPGVYKDEEGWKEITSEQVSIAGHLGPGMYLYGVPLYQLSQKTTNESRSRNIVVLGSVAALFNIPKNEFINNLTAKLGKKDKSVDSVVAAFEEGYNYVRENVVKLDPYNFERLSVDRKGYKLMDGNKAVAQGAIDAGCKLYAGYPITPATKIMEVLFAELPKHGGVVVQTEDEISAIGHVTGAGFAGVRAMTATSGPGFCLMTEFIGYNVMSENPVVIVDSQRGGPATGLPTKTEQSDLNHALFGGNGDTPRIVVAPTSVKECYQWTAEAFYLAEKYQMPVIILIDLFLSLSVRNVELDPLPDYKKGSNKVPSQEDMKLYLRQKMTDDGVSPRALPGQENGYQVVSGLEQNEYGTPVYDEYSHTAMTQKRFRKIQTALDNDVPLPERIGQKGRVKLGVISWGSTAGAVADAVDSVLKEGKSVAMLKLIVINPLKEKEIQTFLDDCEKVLVPELNYQGQFANWLAIHFQKKFFRYNKVATRPITHDEIEAEINRLLKE